MRANLYDDIHNTFTVPLEKYKMVSFTSSIMKNNNLLPLPRRLPVKLICCIAFGSASSACRLPKYVAIV